MTEDEFRNINLLLRMNLDGDTATIVVDRNFPIFYVDFNFERIHVGVIDLGR